ncbi:uncharacterized protein [Triticum aestivum]|uniref:uncharacterized protein isoform X1 n=1 Tax=Triticum aestivum TaxID=4565 RepID=UPI001D023752|nr:uncharacterized protein LOC123159739 isoform X1 [Triticum aestivum]
MAAAIRSLLRKAAPSLGRGSPALGRMSPVVQGLSPAARLLSTTGGQVAYSDDDETLAKQREEIKRMTAEFDASMLEIRKNLDAMDEIERSNGHGGRLSLGWFPARWMQPVEDENPRGQRRPAPARCRPRKGTKHGRYSESRTGRPPLTVMLAILPDKEIWLEDVEDAKLVRQLSAEPPGRPANNTEEHEASPNYLSHVWMYLDVF